MVFGKDKIIGTLVPVFSLKSNALSPSDQGTFAAGFPFLKWLKLTGQHAWQMLPLSETQLEKGSKTKHVPSPYKGYGIGIDPKYLSEEAKTKKPTEKERALFLEKHSFWVEDYAFFCALRDQFGTDNWREWDQEVRDRDAAVLVQWRHKLDNQIASYVTQQWQLHMLFEKLHSEAKKLDILLIGDLPFYISCHSPLVWKYRDLFQIDAEGKLQFLSGAASNAKVHFGRQVWGHPLYDWSQQEELLKFWKMRLLYRSYLYDVLRFDYAVGFFHYAAKHPVDPERDETREGPGETFFHQLLTFCHQQGLVVFVEDSGKNMKDLRAYLHKEHLSGIKILRFAVNEVVDEVIPYYADVPTYVDKDVAYTTTHDTEPLLGYVTLLTLDQRKRLAQHAGVTYNDDPKSFACILRRAVLDSQSKTVILPLQDWLLSSERINIPGTEKEVGDTNWHFSMPVFIEDLPREV